MLQSSCPYCKIELPKFPAKKTRCKSCLNYYYPRKAPGTSDYQIVTELVKERWEKDYKLLEDIEVLMRNGIEQKDVDIARATHRTLEDAVWSLFNKSLLIHSRSFSFQRILYYMMARFSVREGRDPGRYIELSVLSTIKEAEFSLLFTEFSILTGQGCGKCDHLNGKLLSVDEANKKKLLPHKPCDFDFCHSMYLIETKRGKDGFPLFKP